MNIFEKIKFLLQKPKVVIVTGNGRKTAKEAIFQVLEQHFKVGKEILIFETELKEQKEFEFLIKKSALPILLITRFGDIPPDKPSQVLGNKIWEGKDFFAGDKKDTIQLRELAKILPAQGYLILNFDDETVREIGEETDLSASARQKAGYGGSAVALSEGGKGITFGFQEGADFRVTDINLNSGTNFKINYKGNIVPIWLENLFGKEQIYSALAAAAVGTVLGLNLVEISSALKNYRPLSSET